MDLKKLKLYVKWGYVLLLCIGISIWIRYSIPWYELLIPTILLAGIIKITRVYSISEGMLHTIIKPKFYDKLKKVYEADPITEKVLKHTHKKSNKRYKMKKKRPRRAR